ncbi:MAG TPA: hypothetical protein VNQ77_01545 [Frankiaceae bacterium]|nr:hypothetical protein [Frankiaceae bacterium]
MRKRQQLLVAFAAGITLAVPAAPAHALPYCGGTWTNHALCSFEAPAGAFAYKGTATSGPEGRGEVSVRVFVEVAGIQYTVGSCANRGAIPVTCTGVVDSDFDGFQHYCEVFGYNGGTYLCADPPPLPLPL